MKLAYILTKYPCRSETFASRELLEMLRIGYDITVFAATKEKDTSEDSVECDTYYRPPVFSKETIRCVFSLIVHHPIGILRLASFILKLVFINLREALSLLRNIGTIASFIHQLDHSQITHLHAYFMSWPALMAVAISKITCRTFSISTHARDLFVESGALNAKVRPASFVAACSVTGHTFLRQRLPASEHKKLYLVHHGIDHVAQAWKRPSDVAVNSVDCSNIVSIGRLVEKKGFIFLLMAYALVREINPETQLTIIGEGPDKKLLSQLANALGISSSIKFTGWMDEETTAAILQQSQILVAPSVIGQDADQDGIPNVILEAFESGIPVIAGKCGGISEILQHYHTGWLVEPGNVSELATAITALIEDSGLRQNFQINARQFCRQHFDIHHNVQLLAHLMETCIAK